MLKSYWISSFMRSQHLLIVKLVIKLLKSVGRNRSLYQFSSSAKTTTLY